MARESSWRASPSPSSSSSPEAISSVVPLGASLPLSSEISAAQGSMAESPTILSPKEPNDKKKSSLVEFEQRMERSPRGEGSSKNFMEDAEVDYKKVSEAERPYCAERRSGIAERTAERHLGAFKRNGGLDQIYIGGSELVHNAQGFMHEHLLTKIVDACSLGPGSARKALVIAEKISCKEWIAIVDFHGTQQNLETQDVEKTSIKVLWTHPLPEIGSKVAACADGDVLVIASGVRRYVLHRNPVDGTFPMSTIAFPDYVPLPLAQLNTFRLALGEHSPEVRLAKWLLAMEEHGMPSKCQSTLSHEEASQTENSITVCIKNPFCGNPIYITCLAQITIADLRQKCARAEGLPEHMLRLSLESDESDLADDLIIADLCMPESSRYSEAQSEQCKTARNRSRSSLSQNHDDNFENLHSRVERVMDDHCSHSNRHEDDLDTRSVSCSPKDDDDSVSHGVASLDEDTCAQIRPPVINIFVDAKVRTAGLSFNVLRTRIEALCSSLQNDQQRSHAPPNPSWAQLPLSIEGLDSPRARTEYASLLASADYLASPALAPLARIGEYVRTRWMSSQLTHSETRMPDIGSCDDSHEESISAQDMDQASEARQIDETLPQYMLQTEEATSPTLVSAETILLRCGAFREDTFWKEDLQKHIGCLRSHRKYFAARPFYAKTKRFDEYDPRPEMSLLVCGNDCCMHGRQANVQTWGSKEAKQGNLIHSRFTSPRTKRPPNALRSSDLWTKNHQLSKWCMLEELIPASVTRNAMCSHPAYRSTSSPCHLLVSADDKESPLFLQLNQTGTIELFCAEYGVCRLASANLPSDGKILDLKLAMTPFQPRRCRSTTAHYSPGEHANVLVSGQGASAAATKESSNISRSKHSKDPYHHLYDQFLDSAIWSDLVDNEQSAQLSNKALRSMLSRATLYFTIATPSKIVVIAYVFRKQGLVQFWSKSFSHSEVLATQTDLSKGLLWVLLRSPKSNGFVLQRYSLGSNESAVSSKIILTDLIGSSDNEEFVSNIHILCSSATVLIQDKRSGKIWIFDAGTLETQRSDLILPGPNLVRSLSDGPDPFLFVFEKRDDSLQTYICQMSSVHSQTLSADARNAILFSARLGQVLSHRIHLLSPNLRIANVTSDSMNLPIVTTLVIDHFMQNQATLELEYPFDTLVGQFNCEIFFPVHGSISAYKSFNPRAHCHVTLFFLDHNDHVVSTYGKTLIAQREVFLKESRRGTCDGHVSSLATTSQTMCTAESKASSGASPMGLDSAKTSTKASASSSSRIETISSHTTKNVANVASGGIGAGATMRTSASRCIDDGKDINSSSASIVNNRSSGLWVPGSSVQSFYGNLQEYSEEIWKRGNLNNLATNDSSPADVNVLKQHPRQSESNGNDTKSDDVLRLERDSGQWNLQTLPLNVSKVVVSVRILQLDEGLDLSSADDPRESTCSATPPPLVLQVCSTGRQSTDGRFPSNIPKDNISKFVDDLCESQSESAVRLLRSLLPIYMDMIWKSLNKTKSRVIRLFHEGVLQADLSHSIATYAFLHDLLASNKNHSDTWTDIVLGCMKDMVNLPMLSAPSIRMFFSIFTEFYEPRLPNVESNLKMLLKILRDYGEQLVSFENKDSQAVFMGLIRRHFKSHQAVFTPMAFELESVFETPQSLQRREELQREVSLLHGGPYQGVSVSKVSLLTTRFLESNIQNPDVALLDGGERNSCRVVDKLTDSLIALQRASLTVEWERYMKSAALSSMNPPLKLSTAVPPALNKDPTLSTSNSMILSAAGIGRSVHATWDCDTPSGKKQNVALAIGLGDPFNTSKPVFLQAVQVTLRIMRGTHRRQVDDYISTSPIGSLSLITFDNEVTARQAAKSKSIDMRWLKTHGNVICERLSLAKWSSDAPPSLVKSSRTLFVLPSVCAKGNFLVAVVNFTDLHGLGSYALCVSATGVEAETPSEQSIRLMERTCSALAEKWTMCSNVMKKFLLSHAEVWESERHPSEDEHNFFQELYTIMAALQAGQTMVSRKLMTIQGCLPVSDHIARLKLCSKLLARSLETFLEEGKSKAHEPDIQNHLIALSRTFGLYCTSRSLRKSFLHALVHVANHVPNLVVKIIRNEIDLNPDVLSWINKADFRFLGDLLREMNSTSNFLPDTVTSLLRLAHECLRKSEAYYHVAHATVNLLTTRSTTMFSLSNPADREQPRRTHSRGGSGLDTCVPDALALLCEAQQLASLVSNGLLRDIYVLSFHIIQQLSVRLGDTQFASAMSDEAVWPMVQSLLVVNNDELISSDSLKRTCAETLMDRICQADEEAWAPLQVNITNLINGSSSDGLIPSMLPLIRWAEIGDTLYVETLRGLLNLTFSIRDSKIWTDLANVLCTVSVDKLRAIPSEEIMDAVRIRLSSGSGEPSVTMNLVRKVLEAFSGAEELHDDYCYIVVGLANLAISTEPLILQELVPCLHHEIMTTFSQVKISRRVSLSIANFLCHGMGRLLDFRKAELSFEKALAKAADLTAATAQVDAKTAQSNILDHLHNSKSKSGPMETPQVSAKGETDILPDFLTPPSGVSVLQWTMPASEGNAHEASPYHVEPQKSTLKSPPLQTATGKKFAQASDKDSKTDHAIAQATAEVERMAQEVALTQWSDELMIDFLLLSIFVLDTPALRSEMRRVDFCNMVCSCVSFEENIIFTHNKLTSQSKWFADEEKWILTSFLARQYKEEANLARLKEVICSSQIGFWLTLRAVIYHLGSLDVGVTLKACLRSAVDLGIECKSAVSESMLLLMETQPQALQKFVEIGGAEILSRYIRGDSGARTPMAVNRNLVIPTLPNSEALKERSDTLLVSLQHMFARNAGKDFPSFIIDPSFLTRTNKDGQNETGDAFQSLAIACSPIENIRVEKSQAQSSVSYYFFSALEKVLSSRFRESYTFSAQCRFENTTEVSFVLDLRQVYRLADIELTFETSLKTSRGVSLVPASIRIEAGLTASELRCCGLKNGTEHSLAHAQNLLLRRCTYCFPVREHTSPVMARYVRVILAKPDTEKQTSTVVIKRISITGQLLCRSIGMSMEDLYFQDVRASRQILLPIVECVATLLSNVSICPAELRSSLQASLVTWACREASPQARALLKKSGFWSLEEASSQALLVESWMDAIVQRQNFMDPGADASISMLFKMQDVRDRSQENILHVLEEAKLDASRVCACAWTLGVLLEVSSLSVTLGVAVRALDDIASFSWDKNVSSLLVASEKLKVIAEILFLKLKHNADGKTSIDELHSAILLQFSEKIVQGLRHLRTLFKTIGVDFRSILAPVVNRGRVGLVRLTCQAVALWPVVLDNIMELAPELYDLSSLSERDKSIQSADCKVLKLAEGNLDIPCLGLSVELAALLAVSAGSSGYTWSTYILQRLMDMPKMPHRGLKCIAILAEAGHEEIQNKIMDYLDKLIDIARSDSKVEIIARILAALFGKGSQSEQILNMLCQNLSKNKTLVDNSCNKHASDRHLVMLLIRMLSSSGISRICIWPGKGSNGAEHMQLSALANSWDHPNKAKSSPLQLLQARMLRSKSRSYAEVFGFDASRCSSELVISKDSSTMSVTPSILAQTDLTAFCSKSMTRGHVFEWKYKLNLDVDASFSIGISTKNDDLKLGSTRSTVWGIRRDGRKWHNSKKISYCPRYCSPIEPASSVTVRLDLEQGELGFYINDIWQGVAYAGLPLDPSYYAFVSLFCDGGYASQSIHVQGLGSSSSSFGSSLERTPLHLLLAWEWHYSLQSSAGSDLMQNDSSTASHGRKRNVLEHSSKRTRRTSSVLAQLRSQHHDNGTGVVDNMESEFDLGDLASLRLSSVVLEGSKGSCESKREPPVLEKPLPIAVPGSSNDDGYVWALRPFPVACIARDLDPDTIRALIACELNIVHEPSKPRHRSLLGRVLVEKVRSVPSEAKFQPEDLGLMECSFVDTHERFVEQDWFHCKTCGLRGSNGCCAICAIVCHHGHDVRYHGRSKFYCDCGCSSKCKSLSDSRLSLLSTIAQGRARMRDIGVSWEYSLNDEASADALEMTRFHSPGLSTANFKAILGYDSSIFSTLLLKLEEDLLDHYSKPNVRITPLQLTSGETRSKSKLGEWPRFLCLARALSMIPGYVKAFGASENCMIMLSALLASSFAKIQPGSKAVALCHQDPGKLWVESLAVMESFSPEDVIHSGVLEFLLLRLGDLHGEQPVEGRVEALMARFDPRYVQVQAALESKLPTAVETEAEEERWTLSKSLTNLTGSEGQFTTKFEKGQEIEIQYDDATSDWLIGVIVSMHFDGTCDVDVPDMGEIAFDVPISRIRRKTGEVAGSDQDVGLEKSAQDRKARKEIENPLWRPSYGVGDEDQSRADQDREEERAKKKQAIKQTLEIIVCVIEHAKDATSSKLTSILRESCLPLIMHDYLFGNSLKSLLEDAAVIVLLLRIASHILLHPGFGELSMYAAEGRWPIYRLARSLHGDFLEELQDAIQEEDDDGAEKGDEDEKEKDCEEGQPKASGNNTTNKYALPPNKASKFAKLVAGGATANRTPGDLSVGLGHIDEDTESARMLLETLHTMDNFFHSKNEDTNEEDFVNPSSEITTGYVDPCSTTGENEGNSIGSDSTQLSRADAGTADIQKPADSQMLENGKGVKSQATNSTPTTPDGLYVDAVKKLIFGNTNFDAPGGAQARARASSLSNEQAGLGDLVYFYRKEVSQESHNKPPRGRAVRLNRELRSLRNLLPVHLGSTIAVRVDERRPFIMQAVIFGPEGTPYDSGCFVFDIYMPPEYPNCPPNIRLMTTGGGTVRFNPNLYVNGKVCLSLLGTWRGGATGNETWTKKSSLLQVLVSIQSAILGSEYPYFNEPGVESRWGTAQGDLQKRVSENGGYERLRVATLRYAIIEQIRYPPANFADLIRTHFRLKQDHILAVADSWIENAKLSDTRGHLSALETLRSDLAECLASLDSSRPSAQSNDDIVKTAAEDESGCHSHMDTFSASKASSLQAEINEKYSGGVKDSVEGTTSSNVLKDQLPSP